MCMHILSKQTDYQTHIGTKSRYTQYNRPTDTIKQTSIGSKTHTHTEAYKTHGY